MTHYTRKCDKNVNIMIDFGALASLSQIIPKDRVKEVNTGQRTITN